jgi:hypothetical protein
MPYMALESVPESWHEFLAALWRTDQDWNAEFEGKFGVFTGKSSHLGTIRAARPLFKQNWQSLSTTEARILLGLVDSDGAKHSVINNCALD